MTSASCTSWSHTYTYDKAGNRTGKDAITYTINPVNEVTALSDNTSFTYDDNGNRTQKAKGDDTWDYTYDYANRLTKVEENDSTIGEYIYDGDGKRLQKTENSITTTHIYLGINTIYEENSTGSACYVYGPTGLIAKRTTINQEFNTYYYHKDHLGSTRSVTDSSKNIIAASTYHPFGETEVEEGSERYLFNGKERDSTDLYYYGARYYDPQIGRFITRDSQKGRLINAQSLNRFSYCVNNPLKYVDIWGEDFSPADQQIEDYLSGNNDQTDDLHYQMEGNPPEIIGDPYYEHGKIKVPTTDGDITVFDAHKKEESNNGTGGSWSSWEEKAKEKREEKYNELRKKSKRLFEMALNLSADSTKLAAYSIMISLAATALCFIPILVPLGLALYFYTSLFGVLSYDMGSLETDLYEESNRLREEADYIRIHGCG